MKVKFANKVFEVLYTKKVAGLTMYAVEDEPNHIDWLVNVEVMDDEKIEPIFNVGDKIQYSKGCGTIMTIEKIENGEYIFGNNMGHTTIENGNKYHLVEQKPGGLSEEDEKMFKIVDTALFRASVNAGLGAISCPYDDARDWLESLKGRVRPPKQKWSKEDERLLNNMVLVIQDYYNKEDAQSLISWLKSLKGRVRPPKQEWSEEDNKMLIKICQKLYDYPRIDSPFDDESFIEARKEVEWLSSLNQNKWKPSDEHIMALRWVLNHIPYDSHKEEISGLLEQLKKLREE